MRRKANRTVGWVDIMQTFSMVNARSSHDETMLLINWKFASNNVHTWMLGLGWNLQYHAFNADVGGRREKNVETLSVAGCSVKKVYSSAVKLFSSFHSLSMHIIFTFCRSSHTLHDILSLNYTLDLLFRSKFMAFKKPNILHTTQFM